MLCIATYYIEQYVASQGFSAIIPDKKSPGSNRRDCHRRDTPARNGGGLMGEKRDKTLYEWIVLIIKLLGAISTLLAVIAELIR